MFLRVDQQSSKVALLLIDHQRSLGSAELDQCRDIARVVACASLPDRGAT